MIIDRAGNINIITKKINVVIKFNLNISNKEIKLKNLDKKHFALKAFIDISEGYSANDVDLSSIMLDNKIRPVYSYSINNNGCVGPYENDVLLLFSGSDLAELLVPGENIVTIKCKIGDIEFEASGTINCEEK